MERSGRTDQPELGGRVTIIIYAFFDERVLYLGSSLVIAAMLCLMSLSGFRAKW